MHQYIVETEDTIRSLFELVNQEDSLVQEQTSKLREIIAEFKARGWNSHTSDLNDDFSDTYVMAAFFRLANSTSGTDKLKLKVARFQALLGVHQLTTQTICGSILQIAKQGISSVHGSFLTPDSYIIGSLPGRILASLTLRDIIWQACNQAIHCKGGNYRRPVIDLFAELEVLHGSQFSLSRHPRQSRAKQIIQLLGWLSYGAYVADMRLLLP